MMLTRKVPSAVAVGPGSSMASHAAIEGMSAPIPQGAECLLCRCGRLLSDAEDASKYAQIVGLAFPLAQF
jgi:hypothetical protein